MSSINNVSANGTQQRRQTEQEALRDQVLSALAQLGGQMVSDDSLVFQGTKFILPQHLEGNIDAAVEYLQDYEAQQNSMTEFSRTFRYRPYDGAYAFNASMMKVFGTSGIGKATYTMFGVEPPELVSVPVSHNRSVQVPWGRVGFGPLNATFVVGATRSDDGIVSRISVVCPRKYRKHIEGFLDVVEHQLKTDSIYRGKAIDAAEMPKFIDTTLVDPKTVVYNQEVFTQLNANLWSLIEFAPQMRQQKIPLKRAVLVEGPYGTGKTLCGSLTAQKAVAHGWTFINVRPGDNLFDALKTAQLYSPAVVWFEDIDVVSHDATSRADVSQLLDALDGIQSKGVEVMAGFTTNFAEKIEKGVLRPGRIDAVISIGKLDAAGFERLVKVVITEDKRDTNIDFDQVAEAMDGFLPAFVREAAERAVRYSMARNKGVPGKIGTADLVSAAVSMRAQLELMEGAKEATGKDSVDAAIQGVIRKELSSIALVDNDGDPFYSGVFLATGSEQAIEINSK